MVATPFYFSAANKHQFTIGISVYGKIEMATNKWNKKKLQEALRAENVYFSNKARINELRRLYHEIVEQRRTTQHSDDVLNPDLDCAFRKHSERNHEKDSMGSNESIVTVNFELQKSIPIESQKKTIQRADDDEQINFDEVQNRLNKLLTRPPTKTDLELIKLKEEEEQLDAQLRIQEKKLRLLNIQQQLQRSDSDLMSPIARHIMKPQYKDIKHLIQLFSGQEDYDAKKWVDDFERACDSVRADDHMRLVFFRQSMKSDSVAELFLRTDSSDKYSDIKANFLANFYHRFSVSEIIDKLRRTTFRSTKLTIIGYILKMQAIATQSTIDEL